MWPVGFEHWEFSGRIQFPFRPGNFEFSVFGFRTEATDVTGERGHLACRLTPEKPPPESRFRLYVCICLRCIRECRQGTSEGQTLD